MYIHKHKHTVIVYLHYAVFYNTCVAHVPVLSVVYISLMLVRLSIVCGIYITDVSEAQYCLWYIYH